MKKFIRFSVFILLLLFVFPHHPGSANVNADWWDIQWLFRMEITISNSTAGLLTNYEVCVVINTANPIAAGKMRADGGDIRFADDAGQELHYWIESGLNTATTRIWVQVLSIPASGSALIYLYYGNPLATGQSSGEDTFTFFDHFNGTVLNSSKWWQEGTHPGVVEVANSLLHMYNTVGGSWQYSNSVIAYQTMQLQPMLFEFQGLNIARLGHCNLMATENGKVYAMTGTFMQCWSQTQAGTIENSTATIYLYQGSATLGQHNASMKVNNNNTVSLYLDGSLRGTSAQTLNPSYPFAFRILVGDGDSPWGEIYLDLVRARKYVEPEPTSSIGVEEVNASDFADSPDPSYPTLLASNGARHVIYAGYQLGANVDAENDGLPQANAAGDDNNNVADEDGIVVTVPMVVGRQAQISVNASAAGMLDAWIDFNDNGNWSDAGEQICANQVLSAGTNNLAFNVPGTAVVTAQTFARFRFSSGGGLSFTGVAGDGEVEDYEMPIYQDLTLLNPDGAVLTANDALDITWSGNPAAQKVHLKFSPDNGVHWLTIAYATENDGLFSTFVPCVATGNGLFRVINADDPGNFDDSNNLVTINFGQNSVEKRYFEAEQMDLTDPMCIGYDGHAFKSSFIYSSQEQLGTAQATFRVQAGVYNIWGRTLTNKGLCNSFYFSIDDGEEILWDLIKNENWCWDRLSHRGENGKPNMLADVDPMLFSLAAGQHTLKFRCREPFARLDRILLTNDLTFHYPDNPKSWIELLTPQDSSEIAAGSAYDVTWRCKNIADSVQIQLSFADSTFSAPIVLAEKTENDSIFTWQVPDTTVEKAYIRILNGENDGVPLDQNWLPFRIVQPPAPADYALAFDGVDDFVQIPHDASLNVSQSFTISFWLKTDAPDQAWSYILGKGCWDEYSIGFYGGTGRISGAMRVACSGASKMLTVFGPSQTVIATDVWYHIAATYDGQLARLFVDGMEQSAKPVKIMPRFKDRPLIIGALKQPSQHDRFENYFRGVLDDVTFWNVVKSADEINSMMFSRLSGDEAGLVLYYSFDEIADGFICNAAGDLNNGQMGMSANSSTYPQWIESRRDVPSRSLQPDELQCKPAVAELYPETFALLQNYPNPFNSTTAIRFQIPLLEDGMASGSLRIYDLQGRCIRTLANHAFSAGLHTVIWDGLDDGHQAVASGVYFYRLCAPHFEASKKLVLIR